MRCLSLANRAVRLVFSLCAAILPLLTNAQANAQCPDGGTGTWSVGPFQRAAGPLGQVQAMITFDPDGPGPEPLSLVVAGSFSVADNLVVNNICYWNGTLWRPLGQGFNSSVSALTVFNGELYAGGFFTASGNNACNRIARWNGSEWVQLGAGLNASVRSLKAFSNRLYVGGSFTMAGGLPANAVASWDGAIWRPLGSGIVGGGLTRASTNPVTYTPAAYAMNIFDGKLYIGGIFDLANGVANRATLVTWDGTAFGPTTTFTQTDGFSPIPQIFEIEVFTSDFTVSSTIYIGGDFTTVGGVNARYIASYRKTLTTEGPWTQVGTGIGGPVGDILLQTSISGITGVIAAAAKRDFDTSSWVAGTYRFASGVWNLYSPEYAYALANYGGQVHAGVRGCSVRVGSDWLPLGPGLNGQVTCSDVDAGNLYLAGNFSVADQQIVNGITRLDANGYHPVGTGVLNFPSGLESITDIAAFNGDVFVTGRYVNSFGDPSVRVMRFDGSSWSSFVPQFQADGNPRLSVVDGNLYFTSVDVYRWTGLVWLKVGGAVPGGRVEALFIWNGALHASGANGVYRLNGSTWQLTFNLRSGITVAGEATVWNNRLFVSMVGTTSGTWTIDELVGGQFVQRFPISSWLKFVSLDGVLYAVSYFNVMRYDGTSWQIVADGGGTDAGLWRNQLTITGTTRIDGFVSPLFATLNCCLADFDRSGSVTPQDIFEFLNAWFMGQSSADINGGGLAPSDIFDFLNAWFVGC